MHLNKPENERCPYLMCKKQFLSLCTVQCGNNWIKLHSSVHWSKQVFYPKLQQEMGTHKKKRIHNEVQVYSVSEVVYSLAQGHVFAEFYSTVINRGWQR